MTSPEVTTVAPVAATSLIVVRPGWLAGSHMRICGLTVICEARPPSGSCFEACTMASSVLTAPNVILSSTYISAGIGLNPMFGPPARTSTLTPVSTPCATSGPVTDFVLVSTV